MDHEKRLQEGIEGWWKRIIEWIKIECIKGKPLEGFAPSTSALLDFVPGSSASTKLPRLCGHLKSCAICRLSLATMLQGRLSLKLNSMFINIASILSSAAFYSRSFLKKRKILQSLKNSPKNSKLSLYRKGSVE